MVVGEELNIIMNTITISSAQLPGKRTRETAIINYGVGWVGGFCLDFWTVVLYCLDFQLFIQSKPFGLPWTVFTMFCPFGLLDCCGLSLGLRKTLIHKAL